MEHVVFLEPITRTHQYIMTDPAVVGLSESREQGNKEKSVLRPEEEGDGWVPTSVSSS
jgi:hypothetical protein